LCVFTTPDVHRWGQPCSIIMRWDASMCVQSAGSAPGNEVNPVAVTALAEWGIDIAGRSPRGLSIDEVKTSDVVITMGCGDSCPVFSGKRYLDWELPDPSGRDLGFVRSVRNEIDRRVRILLSELLD